MATHNDEHFIDRKIVLDGNTYVKCHFKNCELVYEGGTVPVITGCALISCKFSFGGAAERTLEFMSMLWNMGGGGVVDGIIDYIKVKK